MCSSTVWGLQFSNLRAAIFHPDVHVREGTQSLFSDLQNKPLISAIKLFSFIFTQTQRSMFFHHATHDSFIYSCVNILCSQRCSFKCQGMHLLSMTPKNCQSTADQSKYFWCGHFKWTGKSSWKQQCCSRIHLWIGLHCYNYKLVHLKRAPVGVVRGSKHKGNCSVICDLLSPEYTY